MKSIVSKVVFVILPCLLCHSILLHLYIGTIHSSSVSHVDDDVTNVNDSSFKFHPIFDEVPAIQNNPDVQGETPIVSLLRNDYWGKDIFHFNSNKSWRPFTVLTFRLLSQFLRDPDKVQNRPLSDEIQYNRYINVILHACVVEMVSYVGISLFPLEANQKKYECLLQVIIRLIFAMHPVAVEIAANGANRPHVIGLFCSLLACLVILKTVERFVDHDRPSKVSVTAIVILNIIWTIGILSSETIVFHVPAVFTTCIAIHWQQKCQLKKQSVDKEKPTNAREFLCNSLVVHLPYFVTIFGVTLAYLLCRFILGIEAINRGILRKGQTPFHFMEGSLLRIVNFTHITCIHILKSCILDPIGVAHEYGYDSVPAIPIDHFDPRILFVLFVVVSIIGSGIYSYSRGFSTSLYFVVFASWFATLFPITGIITTGTFIAERLMYPSAVAFSIFSGRIIFQILVLNPSAKKELDIPQIGSKLIMFLMFLFYMYTSVKHRISDWCISNRLILRTLERFPKNAKANHDVVAYYVSHQNLEKALEHAERAVEILPEFCHAHYTIASLNRAMNRIEEYEYHLLKAIPCMNSYEKALPEYMKYTQLMTEVAQKNGDPNQVQSLQQKFQKQMMQLRVDLKIAYQDWNQYLPKDHHFNTEF